MAQRYVFPLATAGALVIVAGCGGGGGSTPPVSSTITSVSVSCTPINVQTGQTSQCSATVSGTGSYNSAVTWSADTGTVGSSGLYTAPGTVPASGSATVKATSTQDSTKSGTATVTVTLPPIITSVTVACSPTTLILGTSTTSTCSATVQGTGRFSSAVNWSATNGTITASGVFTPTSGGTVTITATSTQDSAKTGHASVNVSVPPSTSVFQIVGPGGGHIAIAADPSAPGTLYASSFQSGLFKSTDGGSTWKRIATNATNDLLQVGGVAVAANGALYVVCQCGANSNTLYRSTDNGNTFTDIGESFSNGVGSVTLDPLNSEVLYLTDLKGTTYRYKDSAQTWTALSFPGSCSSTTMFPDSSTEGRLYYESPCSGFYASNDSGNSWTLLNGTFTSGFAFAQSPSDSLRIYANANICGNSGGSNCEQFYSSSDGGVTWTDRFAVTGEGGIVINPTNPDEVFQFAGSFLDPSAFAWVSNVLVHSTDGGASWSLVRYPVLYPAHDAGGYYMSSLQWLKTPSILIGVMAEHLWKIPFDASPWVQSDQGLTGNFGIQIAADPNSPNTLYLAASNGSGISKSTDGGTEWKNTFNGSAQAIAVDPFDSMHVLAGVAAGQDPLTFTNALQVSSNGGITWSDGPKSTGLQGYPTMIVFDPKAVEPSI